MDQFAKTFISDDICNEIERLEEENKENPDAIYSLYVHIIPREISDHEWDKYYVGITKQKPSERWGSKGIRYNRQVFYKAISKYGWDNIKHVVITSKLTKTQSESLEIKTIKYLKSNSHINGYNCDEGGNLKNIINCNSGFNKMKIAQYTLDGNLINIYDSQTEAGSKNGIDQSCISNVISGKTSYVGGYYWLKVEQNKDLLDHIEIPKLHKHINYIYQFSLDGKFIKKWDSPSEASKYYGVNIISTKPGHSLYGYQWKYEHEINPLNPEVAPLVRKTTASKIIYAYDINGYYIACFEGLPEAIRALNIPVKVANYSILKKPIDNNKYHGYRLTETYYDHLPPLTTSVAFNKRKIPVARCDPETGNVIEIYGSSKEAGLTIGRSNPDITKSCKNQIKHLVAGSKWKYLKDVTESEIIDSFLLQKYHELLLDTRKDEV